MAIVLGVNRMRCAVSVLIALILFSPWAQSAESRLSISAAISGIESSMLRECVQRNVSGLSFADELTRLECREESDSDNIDSLAGLEQFSGLTVLSQGVGEECGRGRRYLHQSNDPAEWRRGGSSPR